MNEDQKLRDMVNTGVLNVMDRGVDLYQKATDAKREMDGADKALANLKDPNSYQWELRLSVNHQTRLAIDNETPFPKLTKEVVIQLLQLLSALFYTEMKEAIKEFNEVLNTKSDGKKTD